MVKSVSMVAAQQGFESEEEADDFDVDEEGTELVSGYEYERMDDEYLRREEHTGDERGGARRAGEAVRAAGKDSKDESAVDEKGPEKGQAGAGQKGDG